MLKLLMVIGALVAWSSTTCQDFSNKGKDFWIAYGNHVRMWETITPENQAEKMELYMTSDVNTTGVVNIPGIGFTKAFSVTANQISTIEIPRSAGLTDESTYNLGIHVTAEKPIVVYSYIYVNAVSGATLCLPVATLGREYYSINFTQVSNNNNSYSYFDIIATDSGTTAVEIIPSQNTRGGHLKGVPYVVNLKQGQVYQALGALTTNSNPFRGADLTGSQIRAVSSGNTKCKKIAVFCGSGKIAIGCNGSGTSDNLYQQMYPVSTWGKTYITVPSLNVGNTVNQNNLYRIFRSDITATVKLNGAVLANTAFFNGQYYEFNSNRPNLIESDKPVLVSQYFSTGGCNGNTGNGDPEMIYLNPVEQTISEVTLNSMQPGSNTNINEHHINVVLKNNPQVINSFAIDGVPTGKFIPLPENSSYAYAQIEVSKGTHNLTCDSGFNATAYGFGSAESYGYSAGTNLKDLYQFVSIRNQYATISFPAGCKNSPFQFSMTFPYKPTHLKWLFRGLFNDTTVNAPVSDSSWIVNGRTLYRYTLNRKYIINRTGTFPITVVADNPRTDGCSGEQEIDYDLQIFEKPVAAFNVSQTGCITDPVSFADSTNGNGRQLITWNWKFGDGSAAVVRNPLHKYTAGGTYLVSLSAITDVGCLSDTVTKPLFFTPAPVAAFTFKGAACVNKSIQFTDASTPLNSGVSKWSWDFGDGIVSAAQNPLHTYTKTGAYIVKLGIETVTGCKSVFSSSVNVAVVPRADFGFPAVCLNDPFVAFTDSSDTNDNSGNQLSYLWNFGDLNAGVENPNTSTVRNGMHKYYRAGNYRVNLQVISKEGCSADTSKSFTVNGALPKADFEMQPSGSFCSNQVLTLKDKSTVDFGKITRIEVYWDYVNDPTVKTVDEDPRAGKTYSHQYKEFGTPASRIFQVLYVAYSGASCLQQQTRMVEVQGSPAIRFDTILPVCQEAAPFEVSAARELFGFTGTGIYSGPGISAKGLFNPSIAGAGLQKITYRFTASSGCTAEQQQTVLVYPSPVVNAGKDKTVFEGNSVSLNGSASAGSRYLWSPSASMDNPSVPDPKVFPVNSTDYTFTATSLNGCAATDMVRVTVVKELKVPNAFSPNGDGINDTWNIEFLDSYPEAVIEVFNRYGQLVYRSVGYNKPWDGRQNGSKLPDGTYYWLINPKNGKASKNGSITILR